MKKNIFYFFCALIFVAAVGFAFIPHIIEHTPTLVDKKFVVSCPHIGKTITMAISNKGFSPRTVTVKTCDKIIFTNIERLSFFQIAFGDHPAHLAYPGFAEKVLGPGKQNSVILTAYGTYKIHDHLRDKIEGQIIVER